MLKLTPVEVVIIDDDSGVRWIIEQTLDLAGISYVSAATGSQGIQLIKQHSPGVAIVDVKLGTMSGLDVVRSLQPPQKTKAILVTGYTQSLEGKVSGLPILEILEKPFDIQELLNVVQDALRTPA